MKKTIFTLMLIWHGTVAYAGTPWEDYLDYPTPKNASMVSAIEYSPGAIPEGYGYWTPDLKILQNQLVAGDADAFRLAYRLVGSSDGGLLEDIIAIIGRSIRPQPDMFLRELSAMNPNENILRSILLNAGLEYTDRLDAKDYELKMRIISISSVEDKKVDSFRNRCLDIIKRQRKASNKAL